MHSSAADLDIRLNGIFAEMPLELRQIIVKSSSPVRFDSGDILEPPGKETRFMLLPVSGLLSVRVCDRAGHGIEVAMVGREGMTGVASVTSGKPWPFETHCTLPGEALRLEIEPVRAELRAWGGAFDVIAAYGQAQSLQMAETAFSSARRTVVQRLARWLVGALERLDGDTVPVTHDLLAAILGVRRPGVTVATHELEGIGAIRARRGTLVVRDRDRLRRAIGGGEPAVDGPAQRLRRGEEPRNNAKAPADLSHLLSR